MLFHEAVRHGYAVYRWPKHDLAANGVDARENVRLTIVFFCRALWNSVCGRNVCPQLLVGHLCCTDSSQLLVDVILIDRGSHLHAVVLLRLLQVTPRRCLRHRHTVIDTILHACCVISLFLVRETGGRPQYCAMALGYL